MWILNMLDRDIDTLLWGDRAFRQKRCRYYICSKWCK